MSEGQEEQNNQLEAGAIKSFLNRKENRRGLFSMLSPRKESFRDFQNKNLHMLPTERMEAYKKLSRRKLLLGSAYAVAGLALAKLGLDRILSKSSDTPTTPEIPKIPEGIFKINDANKIINLDPGSIDRESAEHKYTNEVLVLNNLKHLDQAFWFVSNAEDRVKLLQKRGEYRESGKFGLRQLTLDEKKFCKENNFHEEWVAICIDSHIRTKEILQNKITKMGGMDKFIQQFRPDLENLIKDKRIDPKTISLDDIMLPVGALIGIAWSESKTTGKDGKIHALADVGKIASINYLTVNNVINEKGIVDHIQTAKNLETVKQKAKKLFEKLSVNGIKYDPYKVLGSDKTGDIGSVQYRPDTAYDFINFCKDKDIKEGDKDFSFNPLGLDAVIGACLMLSIGQIVPLDNGQEDWRIAYINGEEEDKSKKESEEQKNKREAILLHMKKSFQRWNGSLVNNILFWRNTYRQATQSPQITATQKH